MDGSGPKKEEPKKKRRFSQEQYDMLIRCSEKKDMTEWNEWRKRNPNEDILLEGAFLWQKYLVGADLTAAGLQSAEFSGAYLQGAKLLGANLKNAYLEGTSLQGADFSRAIVDGGTLIWKCEVDGKTKFEGVGLDAVRIYPELKQLLEYNIRRMNWEEWYQKHWFWRWPVRLFWAMSDYGRSTGWIVGWFFGLAAAFALVYWLWPSFVMVNKVVGDIRGFWHGLYFSVVTMTTLGFGDIAANPDSWWGQSLLMLQVILGYVLLGALVTRFAVLFTAGGPAGKFADEKTIRHRLKELWSKIKKKD